MTDKNKRTVIAVILVALALISLVFGLKIASTVGFYKGTIESLDDSRNTVLELMASSTAASALITLIPGDVMTPIAEKLTDVSVCFAVVLCAIYLEKFMLTICGFLAFVILIPLGLLCYALGMFQPAVNVGFTARKLVVVGLVIAIVIPASAWVSGMVEKAHSDSIQLTIDTAKEASSEVEDAANAVNGAASQSSWWSNLVDGITSGVSDTAEKFEAMLNDMVEALAVMIVTDCIIPILVLVFFIWLAKSLLRLDTGQLPGLPKPRV